MLIPLSGVKNFEFFWGIIGPFCNYFVKTIPSGYHKIVIPIQHQLLPHVNTRDKIKQGKIIAYHTSLINFFLMLPFYLPYPLASQYLIPQWDLHVFHICLQRRKVYQHILSKFEIPLGQQAKGGVNFLKGSVD